MANEVPIPCLGASLITPDWIRKCVVFLAYRMANGEMRYVGTRFFIGRSPPGYSQGHAESSGLRLVTARHLLDRIAKKLGLTQVFLRINTTSGNAIWVMSEISEWKFHPSDENMDIAMLPFGFLPDFDHRRGIYHRAVSTITEKGEIDMSRIWREVCSTRGSKRCYEQAKSVPECGARRTRHRYRELFAEVPDVHASHIR
jgi:hypothetical protein